MYFSVRSILDVCGEKSLHNINISLFIKIDQNKLLPYCALSDPRQWCHVMQLQFASNSCRVNHSLPMSELMHQTWKMKSIYSIPFSVFQCYRWLAKKIILNTTLGHSDWTDSDWTVRLFH